MDLVAENWCCNKLARRNKKVTEILEKRIELPRVLYLQGYVYVPKINCCVAAADERISCFC